MIIKNRVYGLLGISAKARKIAYGADSCLEEMKNKRIYLLIVAEDASQKTIKNYRFYTEKYQVPFLVWGEIEKISQAIGKRNKAIVGIKDINLSNEIQKIINGGEIIG